MSKLSPKISRGNAYLVQEYFLKRLEGKLLTLIEVLGLPEKQEEQFKSVVRQEIYRNTGIYIGSSLNDVICDFHNTRRLDGPVEAIKLEDIK